MKLEINVPSSLSEITLGQYQKFLKTQEGSNDEEFVAQKMIELFCDMQLKDIVKMKLTSINDLIAHFTNIFNVKPQFQPTFKIGSQEFGFITNLEEITFGEYVDLETNLQNWDTYHIAMAVMYRPITQKFKTQYKIRDYEPMEEMQELMKFAPVDVAISSSVFFLEFRKRIVRSYGYLFGTGDNEESENGGDFSDTAQFAKQWGWYQAIYGLAKGDLTKFDTVTGYRLTQCLTYLTFEKQKNEIEQRQLNKLKR
jgi:hypothetical protein